MATVLKGMALAALVVAGSGITGDRVLASSLLTACKPDVAWLCNGVRQGRGRISACLFAHDSKISNTCRPELMKVTSSETFKRAMPVSLKSLKGTDRDERLRRVCAADIKSRCGEAGSGADQILACLYAWSNRLDKACYAEASALLEGN